MHLQDVATPAAIVDELRLARNLERMQSRMNALGVAFRPHVKTAKCIEIAKRQRALGVVEGRLHPAQKVVAVAHAAGC